MILALILCSAALLIALIHYGQLLVRCGRLLLQKLDEDVLTQLRA